MVEVVMFFVALTKVTQSRVMVVVIDSRTNGRVPPEIMGEAETYLDKPRVVRGTNGDHAASSGT